MRALVTGAAGFIGSHLATRLLDEGHDVVGVDSFAPTYDPAIKRWRAAQLSSRPRFRLIDADLASRDAAERAFAGERFDACYHLGGWAGVRQSLLDPWKYMDANATGTLNVLDAARRRDCRRVLVASTSSLYGNDTPRPFREDAPSHRPLSPYAASKRAAEAMAASYAHNYGMDTPVPRFFTVYGPAGRPDMSVFRFIEWISRGQPLVLYGDGAQTRDFTFVTDIVDGVIRAADRVRGFDIINLGNDQPAALLDMLGMIEKELGAAARIERRPMPAADVGATHADITKARTMLGWEPKVPLAEGIARTVAWHQKERAWVKGVNLGEN